MMFKKSLPEAQIQEIIKDGVDVNFNLSAEEVKNNRDKIKKSSTWFGWFSGSGNTGEINADDMNRVDFSCQTEAKDIPGDNNRSRHGSYDSESEKDEKRNSICFRKTLRLNDARIKEMK